MKHILILFYMIVFSNNLKSQTIIASTNVSKTVEYSYDHEGNLIKNFSSFEKVIPDSVEITLKGIWSIKKYESWEKEKTDDFPTTLKFEDNNLSLIQGNFLNSTTFLNGNFKIVPNNAEGAEIIITNIDSSPQYFYRIEMYVIHCEADILFVSMMTFDSERSNVYHGLYKITRQK